jgi:hypothetical protein
MKYARVILLSVLVFTMVLCSCGAGQRHNSYEDGEINADIEYTVFGNSYAGHIKVLPTGEAEIAFISPKSLSGLTVTRNSDGSVSATYGGENNVTISLSEESASYALLPVKLFSIGELTPASIKKDEFNGKSVKAVKYKDGEKIYILYKDADTLLPLGISANIDGDEILLSVF